jgi:hypothetical protein
MARVSPPVTGFSWGHVEVGPLAYRDAKLFPGGSREWDWRETGTQHVPGVQLADAIELIERGADVIVLSRGVDLVLQVPESTVDALTGRGLEVHVRQSEEAVELYNRLAEAGVRVAALIHSTC